MIRAIEPTRTLFCRVSLRSCCSIIPLQLLRESRHFNSTAAHFRPAPDLRPSKFVKTQLQLPSYAERFQNRFELREGRDNEAKHLILPVRRILDRNPESYESLQTVIYTQLSSCETAEAVLRVVTVALRQPEGRAALKNFIWEQCPVFARRLAAPSTLLRTINTISARYEAAGLEIGIYLVMLALRCAARSYNPVALKRWLKWWKARNRTLSRGLLIELMNDLRQGQIQRPLEVCASPAVAQGMRQVLLGFDDAHVIGPYHLGLYRESDQNSWIISVVMARVFADCRDVSAIWDMWEELEKDIQTGDLSRRINTELTEEGVSSRRGYLINQMIRAGSPERAWMAVNQSRISGNALHPYAHDGLLHNLEFAKTWDQHFQSQLETKWTIALEELEANLNLEWKSSPHGGYHTLKESHSELPPPDTPE